MKSLIKIVNYLLQPWSTICKPKISSFAKAVIVGCSVSFMLWAVGWTLFTSSADLNNRSVVSVLVSPDGRTIKAEPDKWAKIGNCWKHSVEHPVDGPDSTYGQSNSDCRGWTLDESSNNMSGVAPLWTASQYGLVSGRKAYSIGWSRSDALEQAKDVWVDAASSLFTPLIVLIVMQTGVLVGYQYFRRSPETTIMDEDIS